MDQLLKNLLKKYSNSNYMENILNLILVIKDIRPSFLYESANFPKHSLNEIQDIIQSLNNYTQLVYLSDNFKFPRILIYKKGSWVEQSLLTDPKRINIDDFIGQYLGFQCVGHDFGNQKISRVVVNIHTTNGKNLMTEVCEYSKVSVPDIELKAKQLTDKMNNVFKKFYIKVTYTVRVETTITERSQQLSKGNVDFIKKNLFDYYSDFENYYISNQKIFESSITYRELSNLRNLDLVAFLHKSSIEGLYDRYYSSAKTIPQIESVAKMLVEEDRQFWASYGIY